MCRLFSLFSLFLFSINSVNAQEGAVMDEQDIKNVIQEAYIDGLCNQANTALIMEGIHPGFNMLGISEDGTLQKTPLLNLLESAGSGLKNGQAYPFFKEKAMVNFLLIDIAGKSAVAKVEFIVGEKAMYIDYLSLLKFESGWKIVSKTYHVLPIEVSN